MIVFEGNSIVFSKQNHLLMSFTIFNVKNINPQIAKIDAFFDSGTRRTYDMNELLNSNSIPTDHDGQHQMFETANALRAGSTQVPGTHWHWSVRQPSIEHNRTILANLCGLRNIISAAQAAQLSAWLAS